MSSTPLLIRPITDKDLASLCDIAKRIGPGFTSLVDDPVFLEKKIQRSQHSFNALQGKPEFFFFVLEDLETQRVIGTSAIESVISNHKLFFSYKFEQELQHSKILHKNKVHTLVFTENHYGEASMLCSLFVHPDHRGLGQGEFLSKSRFLFIAQFPNLFKKILIAEIRAFFNEDGKSPFWEGLNRHFFDMDYTEATHLIAQQGPQFIKDLMPKFPVYVCLLPESVKAAIGKPHPNALAALHILEKEGFKYQNYVDILDGGPIVEVKVNEMKTLKENIHKTVVGYKPNLTGKTWIIANTQLDFRATLGCIEPAEDNAHIYIEAAIAERLNVTKGDTVRISEFR